MGANGLPEAGRADTEAGETDTEAGEQVPAVVVVVTSPQCPEKGFSYRLPLPHKSYVGTVTGEPEPWSAPISEAILT